jgi:hypothetical protein
MKTTPTEKRLRALRCLLSRWQTKVRKAEAKHDPAAILLARRRVATLTGWLLAARGRRVSWPGETED